MSGSTVVVAATGDPLVDAAVAGEARRRRALVNVVDAAAHCDFIVPSMLRRGPLQIAVSTSGRSPALAREIRRRLEPLFDVGLGEMVEEVGRLRAKARSLALTNAFSEKVENHKAMVALHSMHDNFGRIHRSPRVTPALEAGVSHHVRSLEEIAAPDDHKI